MNAQDEDYTLKSTYTSFKLEYALIVLHFILHQYKDITRCRMAIYRREYIFTFVAQEIIYHLTGQRTS